MATVERVFALYREKYFDLNVQHFHEKLQGEHTFQFQKGTFIHGHIDVHISATDPPWIIIAGYDSYPPNRRVRVRIEATLEAVDDG